MGSQMTAGILRPALALLFLCLTCAAADAQYWPRGGTWENGPIWNSRPSRPSWDDGPAYRQPRYRDWDDDYEYERPRRRPSDDVRSGGPRPAISPVEPHRLVLPTSFPVGSVVIDTRGRQLLFIESENSVLHYPISVGREGFSWTGTETVSRKAEWPDWHPPEEMREREPHLPKKMLGGLSNPLGAVAIYLGNTLYRIHGTNDPKSIGRAASSGCFRMLNGHAVDLASRIQVGTQVTVVSRLPADLERMISSQVSRVAKQASSRVR